MYLIFMQARVLASKMLKQYTAGSQQCIQLKQLSFSTELVSKLEGNLKELQNMYHDMQALILAGKNTDDDYVSIVNKHIALQPLFTSHTVAAKALLASAAPKKEPKKKVIQHACLFFNLCSDVMRLLVVDCILLFFIVRR
jgi:hypothetical protein